MFRKYFKYIAGKGRSHLLIRTNKKRRRTEESNDEEVKESDNERAMRDHSSQLQTQISDLTKELESSEKKTDKHDEYADMLNSLYH